MTGSALNSRGGAIFVRTGIFENNKPTNDNFESNVSLTTSKNITLTNSNVSAGHVYGGGIYSFSNYSKSSVLLEAGDSILISSNDIAATGSNKNNITAEGSAIFSKVIGTNNPRSNVSLSADSVIVNNNKSTTIIGNAYGALYSYAKDPKKGVSSVDINAKSGGITFESNTALTLNTSSYRALGGAIASGSDNTSGSDGLKFSMHSNVTLTTTEGGDIKFINNEAITNSTGAKSFGLGGAIYSAAEQNTVTLNSAGNIQFKGNAASGINSNTNGFGGGAIYVRRGDISFQPSKQFRLKRREMILSLKAETPAQLTSPPTR